MTKLDIPEPPKLSQQLLLISVVLFVLAILTALFAKVIIGFIIFLLGAIMGIGSQVAKNRPLDK